jgi:hypothetical protein
MIDDKVLKDAVILTALIFLKEDPERTGEVV